MSKIKLETRGEIVILTLNNNVTNAICPEMVTELTEALAEIKKHAKGVIICGGEKFFSMGLDLPKLILLDKKEMSDFWMRFNAFLFDFFTLPLPTACVLLGHTIAGGNILALTCDFRLACNEEKKIGLNEINLGVPVPYLADMILQQVVGDKEARRMMYQGEFVLFPEAEKIGLIDEIHPIESVLDVAVEKITKISRSSLQAFSEIKSNRIEDIKLKYERNFNKKTEFFMNCWLDKSTRKKLEEAAALF